MFGWLAPITNPLACLGDLPQEESVVAAEPFLKQLEAQLMRRVQQATPGQKPSLIRGQGLDFADLREYIPGDDIRKIDWNVFARTLHPHIREYHEEKQLTVWVFVDLTPSMFFGSRKSKAAMAIELAGLIALLTHYGRNKLGMVCMTGTEAWVLPPAGGYGHVQMAMQRLLDAKQRQQDVVMPVAADEFHTRLAELARIAGKQTSVFVLSDFMTPDSRWLGDLGNLSRNTGIYSLIISDEVEYGLPENTGLLSCFDPESGQVREIDTADKSLLEDYRICWKTRMDERIQSLASLGRVVSVRTDEDPVLAISNAIAASRGGLAHA